MAVMESFCKACLTKAFVEKIERDQQDAFNAVLDVASKYNVSFESVLEALQQCGDKPEQFAAKGQTILTTGKYKNNTFEKSAEDLEYVKYIMTRNAFTTEQMKDLKGYFNERFQLEPSTSSKTGRVVTQKLVAPPQIQLKVEVVTN